MLLLKSKLKKMEKTYRKTAGNLAIVIGSIFLVSSFCLQAESGTPKTGWKIGGLLPTITFDSDLGFQYGGLVNIFNYGDGSNHPNYTHSLYFEISRFTKGSGVNRFFFDSDQVIKGIRTTFDLSYITDPLNSFYGFNGYQSVYDPALVDSESPDYLTRAFYAHDRKMFRSKLDVQGKIGDGNFGWVSGFELYNFKTGSVDIDKLNKGKDDDLLPNVPGLYDRYVGWGFISNDEKDGGWVNYFKAGLTFDSRDNEAKPMKGLWTEAVLMAAPGFLTTGNMGHARLSFTHRQYFTLIPENLSLAYRIILQQNILGKTPFYLQPLVITSFLRSSSSEGLGGSRTLRGILRNRIVGEGFALGNVELRWKFLTFDIGSTNVYLGLNGFVDAGLVTSKADLNLATLTPADRNRFFSNETEKPHIAAGLGLRIAINRNFIVAVDYGKAFDERDGSTGMYIGLNYLF